MTNPFTGLFFYIKNMYKKKSFNLKTARFFVSNLLVNIAKSAYF